MQDQIQSLYIHIPFCKRKCHYCDFTSYAGKEHLIDEYVEALIKEIKTNVPSPSGTVPAGRQGGDTGVRAFNTIYFGGGTPSLLEPHHFEKIITSVCGNDFVKISSTEISIEANPGTLNKEKVRELKKLGINRLSIGAQSFNDHHLKFLGRIHSSKDTLNLYDHAREAEIDNISLDLIFHLPNQSLPEWKNDLKKAALLKPEHISTYNLKIEEGTHFHEIKDAINDTRNEDTEINMYNYAMEFLKAVGYRHYEISNFSRPGFQCKHNLVYWKNKNYIGLGAGAHSHINGKRWANPATIEKYMKLTPRSPQLEPDSDNLKRETIIMGLRLSEGLHFSHFKGFDEQLNDLYRSGLLMLKGDNIRLTKKGLFLANEVFEKFV